MLIALLFWLLALISCGFAALFGGWSGRACAIACLVGIIATGLVPDQNLWVAPNFMVMGVDTLLFVALAAIAYRSRRWFPVWFAGFQLVSVIVHIASILAPAFAPTAYFLLQSFWAIPMFAVLVIGVILDRHGAVRCD